MRYDVVLRATSSIRLPEGQRFVINGTGPTSPLTVAFRTQYVDLQLAHHLPLDLVIIVNLESTESLAAASQAIRIANRLAPVLSVVANGVVFDAKAQLVLVEGGTSTDFVQFLIPEPRIAEASNVLDANAAAKVVDLLEAHPNNGRLLTAITQYNFAMRNWQPTYEVLAVSHLYAGMEALTQIAVSEECQARGGITREDLAKAWAVGPKRVDSEARKKLLFANDTACYKDASDVRHGFVHGFLTIDAIEPLAVRCRDKTAAYLRAAIIRMLKPEPELLLVLEAKRYASPQVAGSMDGLIGTLAHPMSLDDAEQLDFKLVTNSHVPKSVSIDNGLYTI